MRKSYVYKITCLVTSEYYFGSSFRAKSDYYWGTGRRIKERIAQYGKENFVKEILEEFDDRVEAHKVENQYIEKFRNDDKCLNERLEHHFELYGEKSRAKMSAAQRGEKNYNFGKHRTEEVKAKIGDAQRGKIVSDDTRAKLSASLKGLMSGEKNPMYGKHVSEEVKAKMSAAHRGKHLSDDTRAKLSAARRGKHWRKNKITGKREYYD